MKIETNKREKNGSCETNTFHILVGKSVHTLILLPTCKNPITTRRTRHETKLDLAAVGINRVKIDELNPATDMVMRIPIRLAIHAPSTFDTM